MAVDLMPLIDTDEVEQILCDRYTEEDEQETLQMLLSRMTDGTIKSFIYDTFDTWAFENYWEVVESAVMDWADYTASKKE